MADSTRNMMNTDILVIGGGAAGMAAAVTASRGGSSVILAEKADRPGGILNRCTHPGFGIGYYGEDMTGQEYAARYMESLQASSVTVLTGTAVLEVRPGRTALLSSYGTIREVSFTALVLATGSYEVSPEAVMLAGTRPAGVMTAGCAQGLINEGGHDIGDRVVVLGSGNVGQIVAGQLTDAGKEIVAIVEKNGVPGGIARNIAEYIEGRHLPLMLRSTVTRVHGEDRVTGVTVRDLTDGTESLLECDTLITALGLIPERTLLDNIAFEGRYPEWVFMAGNCDQIYDFADAVTASGEKAGAAAAHFCGSC